SALECNQALEQNTVLTQDLLCRDTAIRTGKDGITIDCKGNTIRGKSAGTGIDIKHDSVKVENCNLANFFTGISVDAVNDITLKNIHVYNSSTGVHAQRTNKIIFDNVKLKNNQYHDLYTKDVQDLIILKLDAPKKTIIDDTRQKEEQLKADLENYTFRSDALLLRHPRVERTVASLNLSLDDFRYAKQHAVFSTTVQKQKQMLVYTTTVTATKQTKNLTVVIHIPHEFEGYQFIRAQGAQKRNMLITFPSVDLQPNETKTFTFEVTTPLNRQQWTVPVPMMFSPKPSRPSQRTAQWILLIWFIFSAFIFIFTKKFLLKKPVTLLEQFTLLLGVLAIWGLSYKFTIEAIQLTKDFIMIMIIAALSAHYFYYLYRHRTELEQP
ncbi:MAG: right-handed parallel beta-helix repeat-containing protein, partial [Candidatus Nanoarchaeia archaeon]